MKHPNPRIDALLGMLASPKLATIDLSLDRIEGLLKALGSPQEKLQPVVHVAGTNGKGSLVAYLTAIMQAAGYKVHRYISPHLVRFNERVLLAGQDISDDYLLELLTRIAALSDSHPVTFFEATTALAFLAYAETPGDILLLETGLGGRLDATNTVRRPLMTAITPVSMDHMDYLGNSLAMIAAEKAGIIKFHTPCITGPQLPETANIVAAAAARSYAPLYRFGREWQTQALEGHFRYRSSWRDTQFPLPALAGEHQVANAGTAMACIEHMNGFDVQEDHVRQGLIQAHWPARLQRLATGALAALMPEDTELWLDGGHNPGAAEALAQWAAVQRKPVHLICGMLKSKDSAGFLAPLAPHIRSLTAVAIEGEPLAQAPGAIAAAAHAAGIGNVTAEPTRSIKSSIEDIVEKEKNDFILLICGSLYLAGNILWQNNQ